MIIADIQLSDSRLILPRIRFRASDFGQIDFSSKDKHARSWKSKQDCCAKSDPEEITVDHYQFRIDSQLRTEKRIFPQKNCQHYSSRYQTLRMVFCLLHDGLTSLMYT